MSWYSAAIGKFWAQKFPRGLRLLSLMVCAGIGCASAAVVTGSSSTIASVTSYTQLEGGDVIFQLTNNSISACTLGFWIRASDGGAKTAIAQLLAAYQSGVPITITADNATFWPGSTTGAACLVWAVTY